MASWLTPNRMGPRGILDALAMGARNMIMTGVLLITVGLIVNVIAMTGVGNTFSLMIAQWAGGNLMVAHRADRACFAGARHGVAGNGGLYRTGNAVEPALHARSRTTI
ncbi:MAG: hypothetical protein R3D43_01395 [Tepidamorphaceae bacterium]